MAGARFKITFLRPGTGAVREHGLAARADGLTFLGGRMYLECVGKTYLYECSLCQYQARISGGADSGLHCEIQTVVCHDCRQLYDVFTRQRRRADVKDLVRFPGFHRPEIPPTVLGQSSVTGATRPLAPLVWQASKLACPVDPKHVVEAWKDPGRCPRCGNFLERFGFPFRAWD